MRHLRSLCALLQLLSQGAPPSDDLDIPDRRDSVCVFGNGPSLREHLDHDLDTFKTRDVIVVNFFANTDEFAIIKPKYYILLDPAFFFEANSRDDVKRLLQNLQAVDWDMTLFIPHMKGADNVSGVINNPRISIQYFNKTTFQGFDWAENIVFDHCLAIPSSINVLIAAIMVMIAIKYKTIYLYGVDFSWMAHIAVDPRTNRAYRKPEHFYHESQIQYLEKGRYKSDLHSQYMAFDAMDRIARFATHRHVSIINCSQGSYIDSFTYQPPHWLTPNS